MSAPTTDYRGEGGGRENIMAGGNNLKRPYHQCTNLQLHHGKIKICKKMLGHSDCATKLNCLNIVCAGPAPLAALNLLTSHPRWRQPAVSGFVDVFTGEDFTGKEHKRE